MRPTAIFDASVFSSSRLVSRACRCAATSSLPPPNVTVDATASMRCSCVLRKASSCSCSVFLRDARVNTEPFRKARSVKLPARSRTELSRSPAAIVYTPEIGRDTSELQSPCNLVCRLLLEKKKKQEHYEHRSV